MLKPFVYEGILVYASNPEDVIAVLTKYGHFPYGGSSTNNARPLHTLEKRPDEVIEAKIEDLRLRGNLSPAAQKVVGHVEAALAAQLRWQSGSGPRDGTDIMEAAHALTGMLAVNAEPENLSSSSHLRALVGALVHLVMVVPLLSD